MCNMAGGSTFGGAIATGVQMLMRRAAVGVVTAGVMFGASVAAGCGPRASGETAAAGPTKTVRFGGYLIDVPAGWPVYRLAARPHQCVRYDRHAVYLGKPGSDQRCPAHLVGRTEAITIDGGP